MTGDKKINFGWVIVAYGVLCMLVLHYGTIGSQAIFLLPITKDLGQHNNADPCVYVQHHRELCCYSDSRKAHERQKLEKAVIYGGTWNWCHNGGTELRYICLCVLCSDPCENSV